MLLPLDGPSALRALRVYRRMGHCLPQARIDLPEPDPSPQRRWTERLIPLDLLALPCAPSAERPLYALSPTAIGRPQASFFRTRVLGTLPEGSFVDLQNGLVIPCPELLFLRMASHLSPEAHTLLAYELAGTYARPGGPPPRNGRVWRPSRHEHRAHQVLSRPLRKEKRIGPLCAQSGKRA